MTEIFVSCSTANLCSILHVHCYNFRNDSLQPQTKAATTRPPAGSAKPVVQPTNQTRVRLEDDVAMSDDEEFKDAADVAMTTESHPLPVPPSEQLVSSMGVSTHRVQVMKASFFGSDIDHAPQGRQPSGLALSHPAVFRTTPTPSALLERSPRIPSGMEQHTPLHLQPMSSRLQRSGGRGTPSSMLPAPENYPHPAVSSLQAQSSVIMAKHNLCQLLPLERSLLSDKTHNIADAGLMMGRSFRVGWGPNWMLTHSGNQISDSSDGRSFGPFVSVAGGSSLGGEGEGLPLRVVVEQVHTVTPERAAPVTPPTPVSVS